jgi:predicted nucleotidyltransferase
MAKKVSRTYELREVIYAKERWALLNELRGIALRLMEVLRTKGVEVIVHGSLARGDVGPKSDVDVFLPEVIPSYIIEEAVLSGGFHTSKRELTQATPTHTVKAIVHIDDKIKVTFPLLPLRGREREFYRFGGEAGISELREGRRVPGVDKRLMMIVPMEYGHYEFSVIQNSEEAARLIGVSTEIVKERIRVLTRRDEIGRTGIYYKEELGEGESFEGKFSERISKNPSLRRLIQQRGMEFKY